MNQKEKKHKYRKENQKGLETDESQRERGELKLDTYR